MSHAISASSPDPEIGLAGKHALQDGARDLVDDADANLREAGVEGADRLGQEIVGGARDTGESNLARAPLGDLADAEKGSIELVDEPTHARQELSPELRQLDPAGRPLEERDAKSRLELLDAAAQRRLREVEEEARLAEAAELRHRNKAADVTDVLVHAYYAVIDLKNAFNKSIVRRQAFPLIVNPRQAS